MEQEQFQRAVQIHERLRELTDVKDEITPTSVHKLWYAYDSSKWDLCPTWKMNCIRDILDKHDKMIRQEIDEEIERLKKEIEEL